MRALALGLFLFFYSNLNASTGDSLSLNLSESLFESPYIIDGDWLFFSSELIKKTESALYHPILTNVPHEWPDLVIGGKSLSNTGYGTYYKRVILPINRPELGIEIPHFFSAYKLIVNGETLYECGVVASSKENYKPKRLPKVISLSSIESDTLDILIQVSNFDHYESGFKYDIRIGSYDSLMNNFNRWLAFNLFVAGGLFISGFIVLLFSLYNRQQLVHVPFYGMFSLSIMYHMLGSDAYPLHIIFPDLNFQLSLCLEHLTVYTASFASGLFVFKFYDRQSKKWMSWIFYIITGVCALSIFIYPSTVFTEIFNYYLIFFGVYILLYLAIIIKAAVYDGFAPTGVVIALGMIFTWSLLEILDHLDWLEVPLLLSVALLSTIIVFSNFAMLGVLVSKINKAKLSKVELGYHKSRQTMLSLISHEIKMPVATLQMNMEMIKRASERPEKFEKVKDKIVGLSLNAVDTIKRMLHDFIYFMSLNQAAADKLVFQELRSFIETNWDLKLVVNDSVNSDKSIYQTDKMTLKYILNTLIGNAEKFSSSEDTPTEIYLSQGKRSVLIEIRDYGIGISDEQLRKLGTEQPKIDENQEITGMGFFLAKDLSERMGHKLWVVSRGTEGTSVFLSLNCV